MPSFPVLAKPLQWGRAGEVKIKTCTCDLCQAQSPCLVVDTSCEEYGEVMLCLPCLKEAFTHHEHLERQHVDPA